jgi:D-alanyl-D-alanine carboxypeptidase
MKMKILGQIFIATMATLLAIVTQAQPVPATAASAAGLQGTRSLVGLVTYPRRNVKLTYATGPVNGQSGESIREDTPFRIASVTKTFVAASIFKLIEQNRFALDSPIAPLLSQTTLAQLQNAQVDTSLISIQQLLGHRSGLLDYATSDAYISAVLQNPARKWTRAQQLEIALQQGVTQPGSEYLYADTNYILLGEIIERRTGQTLAAGLRSLLNFSAQGLNQTYLETAEPAPAGLRPRLHSFVQGLDTYNIDASFDLYGGGGLVSTAGDLTRFFRALFSGRIVNVNSLTSMTSAVSGGGFNETAYALGLMPFYIGNTACFGHEGFASVVVGHCPSIDYTFVFAAGSDQIPDIRLTQQGVGYQLADYVGIDTTPRPYARDFERTRCPTELLSEAAATTCGVLAVDEERGVRGSRKLHLPVWMAKHKTSAVRLQPLLLLGGGPGDALFPTLPALLTDPTATAALVDGQDVIAMEYRGTGAADPKLQCDARLTGPTTVQLCLSKMARLGVHLNRYNGVEFANDIEQLRRSLRVAQWNVAGFSYGTREALTLLRERPETVRSLVLDGVNPPDESFANPQQAARALNEYFTSCQSDVNCNNALPNLRARFVAKMQQLNQLPLQLNGQSISGDKLIQTLTLLQGSPELLAYIPAVMDRFAGADVEFIGSLLVGPAQGELLPPDPTFSDALFFSTICNESAPFVNRAQYNADANSNDPILRAYSRRALETLDLCPIWPSGRGADKENRPVALTVPSIVLISTFDLQTPAVNGRELVARHPLTARGFEFPVGHIALQQAPACALQLLISFERTGNPARVDSSCLASQPATDWRTAIDADFFALIGLPGN